MAHTHEGESNAYYVEQLSTIGICGALGGVAIMLWARGLLSLILAPKFFLPVLLGGIGLLVLVAARAVTVWLTVGRAGAGHVHDHDHEHDHDHHHRHDHDHDHAACDHDHDHGHTHITAAPHSHGPGHVHTHAALEGVAHEHDHGHSHGWAPWRYVVLLLPVALYFMNLPNEALSAYTGNTLKADSVDSVTLSPGDKGFRNLTFLELERARYTAGGREDYQDYVVRLSGRFEGSPVSSKKFTLFRDKVNCCVADAIRISLVVESPEELDVRALHRQWVEVEGKVAFAQQRNNGQYVAVVVMKNKTDVKIVPPDPNPYLY